MNERLDIMLGEIDRIYQKEYVETIKAADLPGKEKPGVAPGSSGHD